MSVSDQEIDHLVQVIVDRVRERLVPPSAGAALPLHGVPCHDDSLPENSCSECGLCVVRRPGSVRAITVV